MEIAIVHAFKSLHDEMILLREDNAKLREEVIAVREDNTKLRKEFVVLCEEMDKPEKNNAEAYFEDFEKEERERVEKERKQKYNQSQKEKIASKRVKCLCGGMSSTYPCVKATHEATGLHKAWALKK